MTQGNKLSLPLPEIVLNPDVACLNYEMYFGLKRILVCQEDLF